MGLSPVIHADKPSWHRAALSCTGAFSVSLCRALQLSVINALVMGLLLLGVLRVPNVLPTLMPAEDPTLRILRNAEETYQRHMALKSAMVGTRKELHAPFPERSMAILRRDHPFYTDAASLSVFTKEYFLLPRYPCFEEERVGAWGAGGKWICKIPLHKATGEIVVYSMGSFGDSSFEEGIFNLYGTKTHTFDPFLLPEKQELMRKLPYVYFHDFGLGAKTEKVTDEGTRITGLVKDIHTIMEELGHTFVDIFKIDCEGCEIGFVENLNATTTRDAPLFGQILMELHHLGDAPKQSLLLLRLRLLGYRMYKLEPNYYDANTAAETAFIHESLVKPKTA